MLEAIRRVCALQRAYSSRNTPEMQERGHLVRQVIRREIEQLEPLLGSALGEFGGDFRATASDGIGRKTHAPWVRFASHQMSPSPQQGYYVVLHFSADGSAFWLTLGCGATTWDGTDFRPIEARELARRTHWAREVIMARFGTLAPFEDQIVLGANSPLPEAFERATALAHRMEPALATDEDIVEHLGLLAERLREVYRAQRSGAHLTPSEAVEIELEGLSSPARAALVGQGFRLSSEERRAIEQRAMTVAREHLEGLGYAVEDHSTRSSYDFAATRGVETVKVEVKGTTAAAADEVFMTRNEVELHRREVGQTALITVTGIGLAQGPDGVAAIGGRCTCRLPWDITEWDATPLAYKLSLRRS
jgi:hypothetical protein